MYFGGVEGGATHSNLVICDETGTVIGRAKGPGTNHWSVGIEECANRILAMVHAAKIDAGIALDRPLDSLGLTLSGCAQDSSNAELASRVQEKDPACSKDFYVATDTAGSLYTGAPHGGMVLIAGTGSNALLLTAEGERHGCGGWGHLLGDEGGAYWIAHKAVKTVFDEIDGLKCSPHPIHKVWQLVQEHFEVDNRDDLLPHAYKHFQKSYFAALTAKLSLLAQQGDPLSQYIFAVAGQVLAAHANALCRRTRVDKMRVVCVGSVWNSWELLKPGFLSLLVDRQVTTQLELVRLRVSSALGAAWLAAKKVKFDLPRDDTAFCQIFYTYTPTEQGVIANGHNGTVDSVNGINPVDGLNGKGDTVDGINRKRTVGIVNGKLVDGVNGMHLNGNGKVNGSVSGHEESNGSYDWS